MTDRETLAARIEAATGPDRELDCRSWAMHTGGNFDTYRAVVPDFGQWQAPYYTASIDAAMMLADNLEDAAVTVTRYATGKGLAQIDFPGSRQVFGNAATPALALAAAAIRAGGV